MAASDDRGIIQAALTNAITAALRDLVHYNERLEYSGVLGIRFDQATEVFVRVKDEVEKPQKVQMTDVLPQTEQMLSVPTIGNLPVGQKFVLPRSQAENLVIMLKEHSCDINADSTSPSKVSAESVTKPVASTTTAEQMQEDVVHEEFFVVENDISDEPSTSEVNSEQNTDILHKRCNSTKDATFQRTPKGHLADPPCECCLVVGRYKQTDRNALRRKKIFETTGQFPPRLPPSKIYKVPAGHVNKCHCCERLANRKKRQKNRKPRLSRKSLSGPEWHKTYNDIKT